MASGRLTQPRFFVGVGEGFFTVFVWRGTRQKSPFVSAQVRCMSGSTRLVPDRPLVGEDDRPTTWSCKSPSGVSEITFSILSSSVWYHRIEHSHVEANQSQDGLVKVMIFLFETTGVIFQLPDVNFPGYSTACQYRGAKSRISY